MQSGLVRKLHTRLMAIILTDLIILTKSQDSSTGRFCSGCHMTEIFWLMNQQINYNLLKRRKNDPSGTAVSGNTAVIATGIEYRLRFDCCGHEFDVQFFGPPCMQCALWSDVTSRNSWMHYQFHQRKWQPRTLLFWYQTFNGKLSGSPKRQKNYTGQKFAILVLSVSSA